MTITTDATRLDLSRHLRPGDRIVWSHACAEPTSLIEALIAQAEGIGPLAAFAATSFSGVLHEVAAQRIAISSIGAIGSLRELAQARRLAIVPCHLSQVASMIDQGLIGCDVALVQVSPADANGNHSFGLTGDFIEAAVRKARVVIAEVNERVPFTLGDAVLPAARIDCAVRVDRDPVEVPAAKAGETDLAIARFACGYINDGATLQVGIGAVPEAILRLLQDRRDLGIHSGMIGDGLIDLVEAGVITNARKPIDRGISITGALIGTRRLFAFADRNPVIALRNCAYTHAAGMLAQLPQLVTVNSAIEVDLTGQVNAEQSGSRYLGGTGGQVDFVRAGARSPGGRSLIALPATARGGSVSRITERLCGPVTTARSDVDVIITEFGAAELRGQPLAERARRLAAIAHPDFREGLQRAAHAIQQRGF
ncbi:MAG TPA: acetyl-CoA hydrolase/transferase C-terminal domain-containing protein [Steroidobacteraceae bacterium]|nr:acetyl-CoA hydrolase/transferase C-terminal domain-containing protein [Steroidobacteraceae bacterium]